MHRILSTILLGLYTWMSLTGDMNCSELGKLPDLWKHYKYEKLQDNATTWWLFVKKHYAGGEHMTDACHHNLPFQNPSENSSQGFSIIPPFTPVWFKMLPQKDHQQQAPLKQIYDFSYTKGILRPPRI